MIEIAVTLVKVRIRTRPFYMKAQQNANVFLFKTATLLVGVAMLSPEQVET